MGYSQGQLEAIEKISKDTIEDEVGLECASVYVRSGGNIDVVSKHNGDAEGWGESAAELVFRLKVENYEYMIFNITKRGFSLNKKEV